MIAPTLTHSWDGYVQTPCPIWCDDEGTCDGTVHVSGNIDVNVACHLHPLSITVVQGADEAEPYISLVDGSARREDKLTADEAEHLANLLRGHARILRMHAKLEAEAGR